MLFNRKDSFYRPLSNESGKGLNKFVFYSPEKKQILLTINQGWLNSEGYSTDVITLDMPGCTRKIKENLGSKEPFIMVNHETNYERETKYILYIPDTMFKFTDMGEIEKYSDEYTISIYNMYQIEIECETQSSPGIKLNKIIVHQYNRTEKKELGIQYEQMMAKIKELGINIQSYELKHLMKHFDLVEKISV